MALNSPYCFLCGRCSSTTVQTTLVTDKDLYNQVLGIKYCGNINHTEDCCVVCAGKQQGIFWVQGISALWCHFSHFLWISRAHITLWLTHCSGSLFVAHLSSAFPWLAQQGEWNGWRIFLVQTFSLKQKCSLWCEPNPRRNALVGWGDGWWIPGLISKYPACECFP